MAGRIGLIRFKAALSALLLVVSFLAQAQSRPGGETVIHVKLKRAASSLARQSADNRFGITAIDAVAQSYNVQSIRRIFPPAGKYEAAHRAYDLDLWYEVRFPKQPSAGRMVNEFSGLSYFEKVEEPQAYSRIGGEFESPPSTIPEGTSDPYFDYQWSYNNTGQNGGIPGADISLRSAWTLEAGRQNVIVAVIDGGIDISHAELSQAMWINTEEVPGNGRDDDNNGYVDDFYGYGFGDKTRTIYPDPHGTHVAGTIGAVSNNSIGVSGIAGGSGTGDGVRLMSLATFGSFGVGGFEQAMVYAADNGAVISQNSWGGGSSAIEAAIQYFIQRAGFDNSDEKFGQNIQTGPLAGGIVIFAAGNQNGPVSYPASYPLVMAVAASDQRDRKATFSNFGPEIDITAPGTSIFSTLPRAYGDYGAGSGTSMACPHVSGVAALIVSKYGGQGVTPDFVRLRLEASAKPIELSNPALTAGLGAGRLNAFEALQPPDNQPPSPVTDLGIALLKYDSLVIRWTATGGNGNEGRAYGYDLRISPNPINESNFSQAVRATGILKPPLSGSSVNYVVSNIQQGQTLYFAIKSFDGFLNLSPISNVISVRIPFPPVIRLETTSLAGTVGSGDTLSRSVRIANDGEDVLSVRAYVNGYAGTGTGPRASDPLAKGRLFAISPTATRIDELDIQTGNVMRSIPLPEPGVGFNGLAFDGQYLYFAHGSNRKIYKLDASNGRVMRVLALTSLQAIDGLGHSGSYLYVHEHESSKMIELNFETGSINRTLTMPYLTFYGGLSFGGSRGTWFISDGSAIVEVNSSMEEIRRFGIGGFVRGLAYSEKEEILYAHSDNRITAYRMSDLTVVNTFSYEYSSGLASDESQYDWLNVTSETFRVLPGQSASLGVNINTTGLSVGNYQGVVNLISNDPYSQHKQVSTMLTVVSSPSILTNRNHLDFDSTFVGYPADSVVLVRNTGLSPLSISSIQSSHPDISVTPASMTLSPGAYGQLSIRLTPISTGPVSGVIQLDSNDPDDSPLQIPVTSMVLPPPSLEITPEELTVQLDAGDTTNQLLQLSNPGSTRLNWYSQLGLSTVPGGAGGRSMAPEPPKQMALGEFTLRRSSPATLSALANDPQTGMIYAKSASTTGFYRYDPNADSWTTLAPSSVPGGQTAYFMNNRIYVWHGSAFQIYDINLNTWSNLNMGFVTTAITSDSRYFYFAVSNIFTRYDPVADTSIRLRNIDFPLQADGATLAYANGVVYAKQGNAYTGNGNTAFVRYFVPADSWENAPEMPGRSSTGNTFDTGSRKYYAVSGSSFKIFDILSESWEIKSVPLFTPSDAITFVGKDGVSGIYFSQQGGTQFGRLETPGAPPWLSLNKKQGTIEPAGSSSVQVNISARGLFAGTYRGSVLIESSRPPIQRTVPVTLNVTGAPDIELDRLSADIGPVYVGRQRSLQVFIRNRGTALMEVTDIRSSHPEITFSTGPFAIYPGQLKVAYAELRPVTPGPKSGTIQLTTNDPNEAIVEIQLRGVGVVPPEIVLSQDTIKTTLLSGASATFPVTISNIGGSELALQVNSRSGWTTASPDFSLIPMGNQKEVSVKVSAGSQSSGRHTTQVEFSHYLDFEKYLQVELEVIPAPNLTASTAMDFLGRYTGLVYDTTIVVTNSGLQLLNISGITTDDPIFSILDQTPITLTPGQSRSLTLRFAPVAPGPQTTVLHIASNDPDHLVHDIQVAGSSIWPSILQTSKDTITTAVAYQSDSTNSFTIKNEGGSDLVWRMQAFTQANVASGWGASERVSSSAPLAFVAYYNEAFYGQKRGSTALYRHWLASTSWELVSNEAPFSAESGGAVVVNNLLYTTYLDQDTVIGVYSFATNKWTTLRNGLGQGSANLTSDGTSLYLAGGGSFAKFDIANNIWTQLPLPEMVLSGRGGLSYLNGMVYAHEGGGFTRFARYDVASQTWKSLASLPEGAVIGSTIDALLKRYYAYGSHGGRNLYEYDIATNRWNAWTIPFPVDDGGFTYVQPIFNRGVYFIQGKSGNRFGTYDANDYLTWIRISPLSGIIPAGESQTIGVNLDARGKTLGTYQGKITITTNDPLALEKIVPVAMNIEYRGPQLTLADNHVEAHTVKPIIRKDTLLLENTGHKMLKWSFAQALPTWLTASTTADSIAPGASQQVIFIFDPTYLPGNDATYSHPITIQTNNDLDPNVNLMAYLYIRSNTAPTLVTTFPDLRLNITENPHPVSLSNRFVDSENDLFSIAVASEDSTIARVDLAVNNELMVTPVKDGITRVLVTATDIYYAQRLTSFKVTVIDPINGLELKPSRLQVSPNPFTRKMTVVLDAEGPGQITLSLVDILGRTIYNEKKDLSGAGEASLQVSGENISPGVYVLKVIKEGNVIGLVRVIKSPE